MSNNPTTYSNGDVFYFVNGQLHREEGPAVEYSDGSKFWYKQGKLHREDGPAVIQYNGYTAYYINGELHREDGPAEIYKGKRAYFLHGIKCLKKDFYKK